MYIYLVLKNQKTRIFEKMGIEIFITLLPHEYLYKIKKDGINIHLNYYLAHQTMLIVVLRSLLLFHLQQV